MDVTFFEHEAYFPPTPIQGENTTPTVIQGEPAHRSELQPLSQLDLLLLNITSAVVPYTTIKGPDTSVGSSNEPSSPFGRPPIIQTYHRRMRLDNEGSEDVVEETLKPNARIVEQTVETEEV